MFPGSYWPGSYWPASYWPKLGTAAIVIPIPPQAQIGGVDSGWRLSGLTLDTAPCGDPTWIEDDQVIAVGSPQLVGWVGDVG